MNREKKKAKVNEMRATQNYLNLWEELLEEEIRNQSRPSQQTKIDRSRTDDIKRGVSELVARAMLRDLLNVDTVKPWNERVDAAVDDHLARIGGVLSHKAAKGSDILIKGLANVLYFEAKRQHIIESPNRTSDLLDKAIEFIERNESLDFEATENLLMEFSEDASMFIDGRMPDHVADVHTYVAEKSKAGTAAGRHREEIQTSTDNSLKASVEEGAIATLESLSQKAGTPLLKRSIDRICGFPDGDGHRNGKTGLVEIESQLAGRTRILDDSFSLAVPSAVLTVAALGLGAAPFGLICAMASTGVAIKLVQDFSKPPKAMQRYVGKDGIKDSPMSAGVHGANTEDMFRLWSAYMNACPSKGLTVNAMLREQESDDLQIFFARVAELMASPPTVAGPASPSKSPKPTVRQNAVLVPSSGLKKLDISSAFDQALSESKQNNSRFLAKATLAHAGNQFGRRLAVGAAASVAAVMGGHWVAPIIPIAVHRLAEPLADAVAEGVSVAYKDMRDSKARRQSISIAQGGGKGLTP